MMEENYYTLTEMGLISHPYDDYYLVLNASYLAATMPGWMPFYLYFCYQSMKTVWKKFRENSSKNKMDDYENDPDFEQEEGDAFAESNDNKKDTPNNESEKETEK